MAEPLTVKQARARFRDTLDREVAELTPETSWQWIMLSTVTGFISGSLPEYSSEETRKKIAPLMNLLNALEKQMQENDTTETSTGNG
ncbi:MAG: hypothetical protein DRQ48_07685 [Gammaproteobacteria bacterium]|nr:MAG: hypothetical protein DRQ48_07685 [Gammaproteobacteria bacterium]